MAARLAFIEAHEGESRLPLFLDEALSITDPERFEAVVTVLMDLVDQGRQIFYLSCDDADVHRWARATQSLGRPAPNVIRLGHLAELSEYVEPPEVQEPQPGESAADYGVRIGVARFGGWSSFESLDLFYLIEDRLDLVHRLRQVQQRRVGPYVALRSRARNPAHLTHEELALIDHRIALFRDFLRLQRVGRGAPIRREVFNDDRLKPSSRALVEDLVQAVDGDVVALMDCVKARQGDAFRRKQRDLADVVEQILEESGALDRDPYWATPLVWAGWLISMGTDWMGSKSRPWTGAGASESWSRVDGFYSHDDRLRRPAWAAEHPWRGDRWALGRLPIASGHVLKRKAFARPLHRRSLNVYVRS